MSDEIINKVEKSGLIQFELTDHWPKVECVEYDISNDLWQGIALKEKDFRAKLKETDWTAYENKYVALHCSVDAIVPTWAFMLLTSYLKPVAMKVVFGNIRALNNTIIAEVIDQLDITAFQDGRVIIKGCSDLDVDESAYVELMNKLMPVAKSIMFGEPCSTVPLYKRK
ncbi:MAG: hypothetical protein ACI9J3_001289 [Parvicellaceae bacterium]|jgi:hypothetical protein